MLHCEMILVKVQQSLWFDCSDVAALCSPCSKEKIMHSQTHLLYLRSRAHRDVTWKAADLAQSAHNVE